MQVQLNPTTEHENRVSVLRTVGALGGYLIDIPHHMLAPLQPDVALFTRDFGSAMLGEAKHTEGPGCSATQVRLNRYVRWLNLYLAWSHGSARLAVCFGRVEHRGRWIALLDALVQSADLSVSHGFSYHRLDGGLHVVAGRVQLLSPALGKDGQQAAYSTAR